MPSDFGLKIGIEGEKEFKKALSEINQSFKVLGSEMNLVTSQFDKQDKSVGALTARNQVLRKEIDAQKDKVETLEAALQNAASSFGENDKRTQSYSDTTFTLSTYAVNGSYRIGGSLSNQYTYDIRVTFGDYFGEAYGYTDLSTAEVILSVRSTGLGLAVGKVAEEDCFDVGWPARFRENVQFDDAVTFSSVLWLANLIFPVGSIRMTVSAADESAFLGGTWVRWGTGRVPVGVNTSDTNFNTVEKTGGANTHTLATAELPSHNHSFSGSVTVNVNGAHTHQASAGSYKVGSGSTSVYYYLTNGGTTSPQSTGSSGSHDHTGSVSGSVGSAGSGAAHNNLQPYITCYFWKRTA